MCVGGGECVCFCGGKEEKESELGAFLMGTRNGEPSVFRSKSSKVGSKYW